MDNKDGITEYAKDSMFPAMGAFSGYLFHSSVDYIGSPALTAVVVYLTIFTIWTIIRTTARMFGKTFVPKAKTMLFSFAKKVAK